MAALLVALAVMAVLMSVALPVWRHDAQREKEAELVWRGQQYIRAIRLFQAKTQSLPTSVDLLVQGHYLRKKFKDPITNDEFDYIGAGAAPGQPGQPGVVGRPGQLAQSGQTGIGRGAAGSMLSNGMTSTASTQGSALVSGTIPGGMMGVRSKSKSESIRLYLGRNHYNEWTFLFVNQQPGGPGGRGQPLPGRGGLPGGRGRGMDGQPPLTPGRGNPFPFPPGGGPGRGRGRL